MRRLCVWLAVFAGALCPLLSLPAPAAAQPNILFIVTDDQAVTGTMAVMPNTNDWFQTGGTRFPNAVATTPLCCPSRSSIFTGRYAHNHSVRRNNQATNLDQTKTLQAYLQLAGYHTGIAGKFLNSWNLSLNTPSNPLPGWDEWAIFDNEEYAPYKVNEQGVRKWVWEYATNYVADRADRFLQDADIRNDAQPWFLYVSPTAPHSPFDPEPKYEDTSVPALQTTPAYYEKDRRDKPPWIQTTYNDDLSNKVQYPEHLRMLKTADDLVNRVMNKLVALGEDRDTLAFFTSDNGFIWGDHAVKAKEKPYLESIRVPFYLRWPNGQGQVAGTPDSRLVANVDMAPTALAAAGVTPSEPMDGVSLIPPVTLGRNHLLTEGWGQGPPESDPLGYNNGTLPTWASLYTHTFQYVEYYRTTPKTQATDCPEQTDTYCTDYSNVLYREYYDLVHDPWEMTNLLADSNIRNDPPIEELSAHLAADRECSGSGCPSLENGSPYFPIATGITEKPDATSARNVTFSFTSTEPDSTFVCKLDRDGWRPCGATKTYTRLRSGNHTLSVRAVGPAGNAGTTASYTWKVDLSLDTRLIATPPSLANSAEVPATFMFDSLNTTEFECTLDTVPSTGATTAPCTSPKVYSGLADGTYKFMVKAVSNATGKSDPNPPSYTWSIDATPPDTDLIPTAFSTHHQTASFTIVDTTDAREERFECSLDDAPFTACGFAGPTTAYYTNKTYPWLGKGDHVLKARAVDFAGNIDPTPATYRWRIDALQSFGNSPDPTWPEIIDGTSVTTVLPDGSDGWFVGGNFTSVGFPGAATSLHTDIVHVRSDHTVDDNWSPDTTDGEVTSMVLLGSVLYIGGTFTGVTSSGSATVIPRNHLAAINTGTGEVTAWDPNSNGTVSSITLASKLVSGAIAYSLYAAGDFTAVGGVAHQKVVELDTSSGVATSWDPSVDPTAVGLTVEATSQSISECTPGNCGYVYLGGAPTLLNEIDRGSGQVTGWRPNPNGAVDGLKLRYGAGRLPTIYAGGTFTQIGSTAKARNQVAEINLSDDGTVTAWDPSLGSATSGVIRAFMPFYCDASLGGFTVVLSSACTTIVGGAFDTVGSGGPSPVTRSRIVETLRFSGAPNDWNPNLDRPALALACSPSPRCDSGGTLSPQRTLAVGGLFTTVGGAARKHLAFFKAP